MFQFIKEISIIGFKSFADKTTIQFKDGLNMVVGPNGCGKSNIIDAFCWGLGENRLKNLRAQNYEELIFSGNDRRSGAGYASVSFVIDNESRILSIDTKEVKVKRTLNKKGENEYFINDQPCRLKDIQQLFMDTGLGRHGYSIMQQGKIDQIITGKPQERRQIFEEASGISLSKMMIKESEQKLSRTKENLNRLNDIISEVEVQVASLEKQAKKALAFKELKNDIQTLEKDIFVYRYIDLGKDRDHKNEKIEKLNKEIQALGDQEEYYKKELEDLFYEIGHLEDTLETIKDKEKTLLVNDARIGQKMELLKVEYENLKKQIEKLKGQRDDLSLQQAKRKHLLESLEGQKESFLIDQQKSQEHKTDLIEEIENYSDLVKEYQSEIQELQKEIQILEHSLYQNLLKKQEALVSIVENLENNEDKVNNLLEQVHYSEMKTTLMQIKNQLNGLESINDQSDFNAVNLMFKDLKTQLKRIEEHFNHLPLLLKDFLYKETDPESSLNSHEKDSNNKLKEDLDTLKNLKEKKEKQLILVQEAKQKALDIYEKEFLLKDSHKDDELALSVKLSQTQEEVQFYDVQMGRLQDEIDTLSETLLELKDNIFDYAHEYEEFQLQKEAFLKEMKVKQDLILEKTTLVQEKKVKNQEQNLKKEKILEQIQKQDMIVRESRIQMELLEREFENKYQKSLESVVKEDPSYYQNYTHKRFNIIEHQQLIQEKRQLLENIGLVNFLALEEYQEVNNRYQYLLENQKDLQESINNLLSLIKEVNEKATQDFMRVFDQVNRNLSQIFTRAFEGGSCEMILIDPSDPLESGIDIVAKPPGKKLESLILLSGGEKTMVTLSLMFSLFMVKPSPFCLLDEVDAALDELNIKRFLRILNDFKDQVQFLIITHNRITAQKGDVFYGVTMQETGVTKVFSFKPDNNKGTDS